MTRVVDHKVITEDSLIGIDNSFAFINNNAADIAYFVAENCFCISNACEGIHTDGVGYAVCSGDLGSVSQTVNLAADVDTGGGSTEVLDVQVSADGNEVDTGKIFCRINNGVFSIIVPDACFAEVCPAGGDQYILSVLRNKFADNSNFADVGTGSVNSQIAAEVQFEIVNAQGTDTQSRAGIEDEFFGADTSGNSHIAENNHLAANGAVERTAAASGFAVCIVVNAAGIEGAVCINSNGTAVVDRTGPAEGSAVDNVQIADLIDLQSLITAVDELTIVAVFRGISTINSQGHFTEVVFVGFRIRTDPGRTAAGRCIGVDITIDSHVTDLQADAAIGTDGFNNTVLANDKVGNAVGVITIRSVNLGIVFAVESIGNDQGIGLQGTIDGESRVGNGLVVVDIDVGSSDNAACFDNTVTLDLEPVDVDITVIRDGDIAVGEKFTDTGFINGINLEV